MILKIKDTFEDDLKMILNDHDYLTLRFWHFSDKSEFLTLLELSNFKVIILKSLRVPLKVFGNFISKILKKSTAVTLSRFHSEQFN